MIIFLCTASFFLGAIAVGSCTAKKEYEYAKRLRRFKIRCDFEDAMHKLYPNE